MIPLLMIVYIINPSICASSFIKNEQINQLIKKWAPLIWLAPDEIYFPSDLTSFLKNMHLEDEVGRKLLNGIYKNLVPDDINSKSSFLVTNDNLDNLKIEKDTFLNGQNPNKYSVPVYARISTCNSKIKYDINVKESRNNISFTDTNSNLDLHFNVIYWIFYPYSKGKDLCFFGKVPSFTIFGTCLGRHKTIGSHVGDWEHLSLSFRGKPYPSEMYLSVHDAGGYYKYDPHRKLFHYNSNHSKKRPVQRPKFPILVRTQNGRPVLFSASGSHGLWGAPGEHQYVNIPRLTDSCGFGLPWKTWNFIKIIDSKSNIPPWITFKGKWGNPKTNCILFKKLGLCEHVDGPTGILGRKQEFFC